MGGFTFKLMAKGDWRYCAVSPLTLIYYDGAQILQKKNDDDFERGVTGTSENPDFLIFNETTKECYRMFRDTSNSVLHKVHKWDGKINKEHHAVVTPETTVQTLVSHGDPTLRYEVDYENRKDRKNKRKFECFLGLFDY